MVDYRDLSMPLKIAIWGGWISLIVMAIDLIVGFIIGYTGAI